VLKEELGPALERGVETAKKGESSKGKLKLPESQRERRLTAPDRKALETLWEEVSSPAVCEKHQEGIHGSPGTMAQGSGSARSTGRIQLGFAMRGGRESVVEKGGRLIITLNLSSKKCGGSTVPGWRGNSFLRSQQAHSREKAGDNKGRGHEIIRGHQKEIKRKRQ